MSPNSDRTDEADDGGAPSGVPGLVGRIPRLGVLSWSFVGVVIASIIVFTALAAVSEIVLPMTFAAVLAVVFKPFVGTLQRRGLKPSLAASLIVVGLLALVFGVVVATARGVIDQADQIGDSTSAAIEEAAGQTDALGIDQQALEDAWAAVEDAAPMITTGVLLRTGLRHRRDRGGRRRPHPRRADHVLPAQGRPRLRRSLVAQVDSAYRDEVDGFVGDACRILRDYGRGRTAMSAIVAVVVGLAALLLGLPLVFTTWS